MFSTGFVSPGSLLWRSVRSQLNRLGVAAAMSASLLFGVSVGLAVPGLAQARGVEASSITVGLSELPVQARETHGLIVRGGPFPYSKDGTVFGNRERLLPHKVRGFYREYTVKTPGSRDRGARRIVCGGAPPAQPEACYYTDDHYATFRRIAS